MLNILVVKNEDIEVIFGEVQKKTAVSSGKI